VRIKGRRQTPGRPVTYGTTDGFLEHFGLESLDTLPGRAELAAGGLLSDVVPADFDPGEIGMPSRGEDGDHAANDDDAAFMTDFMDGDDDTDD
jgi:segregation and condensation protein B